VSPAGAGCQVTVGPRQRKADSPHTGKRVRAPNV